ncbi:hypothetical protein Y1Q_0010220 [Alligator mississippiensis]|uniref:Uncharacterized protein n=1 Tax=Alligator mississippiensis TaxID=8496 RepID=A0A151NGC2_ALLMI|nr:hypothetical protein Y1Q_0010220 [Alligator mississippiensis]
MCRPAAALAFGTSHLSPSSPLPGDPGDAHQTAGPGGATRSSGDKGFLHQILRWTVVSIRRMKQSSTISLITKQDKRDGTSFWKGPEDREVLAFQLGAPGSSSSASACVPSDSPLTVPCTKWMEEEEGASSPASVSGSVV